MFLKRNFTAKHAKTAKSLYALFLLVRTLPVVCGSRNSKGVFVVNFTAKRAKTAKVCTLCFSLFASFALFAVHVSKTEFYREMRENREKFIRSVSPCSYPSRCSRIMFLKRRVRNKSNREIHENREQKRECTWENMMGFFPSQWSLPSCFVLSTRRGS